MKTRIRLSARNSYRVVSPDAESRICCSAGGHGNTTRATRLLVSHSAPLHPSLLQQQQRPAAISHCTFTVDISHNSTPKMCPTRISKVHVLAVAVRVRVLCLLSNRLLLAQAEADERLPLAPVALPQSARRPIQIAYADWRGQCYPNATSELLSREFAHSILSRSSSGARTRAPIDGSVDDPETAPSMKRTQRARIRE